MNKTAQSPQTTNKLLAYLRLFRAPNVFTALADIAMGYLFVQHAFAPVAPLALLLLASGLLYTAGMVLNDVYDMEIDRRQRPQRPLPSGAISRSWATALGYAMLVGGVACGAAAGYVQPIAAQFAWRSGAIAAAIAAAVVLYDAVLKKTPLGPLGMGVCRLLNVLLGMSLGADAAEALVLGFGPHHLLAAGGIGVYIVGVTWFARTEAAVSNKPQLFSAILVMAIGIGLLVVFPRYAPPGFPLQVRGEWTWPLLMVILGMIIIRRCSTAAVDPQPQYVQAAVKHCILSLIVLDAAVAMQCAPWIHALAVLALLAPTLLLGRWVYST